MPSEAKMRPAQLPVHSQNYSSLRKRSFKSACRRAVVAQQPVSYRGQQLTPVQVRRSGNCPPRHSGQGSGRLSRQRAGLACKELRVLSWNAGHLGQQQWAEIKSWLQTEAKQVCDVLTCFAGNALAGHCGVFSSWLVLHIISLRVCSYCGRQNSRGLCPTSTHCTRGGFAQPTPPQAQELTRLEGSLHY